MTALTKNRNTVTRSGDFVVLPVAATKTIYAGSLVALDAAGNATPGATATTLKGLGRAEEHVDNANGAAGEKFVKIRTGIFPYANSADADEVTRAAIKSDCYIVDDQTVAKTDGTGSRSVAGQVFDVDEHGVWVKFS
tara:strand:+ start:1775 stop:2185 length:411 start_codon:yes stop_codon:yes gene_type:complete